MARVIKSDFVALDLNNVVNIEVLQDFIPDVVQPIEEEIREDPGQLAERIVQEAKEQADKILNDAQTQKSNLMNNATQEIERLRKKTEKEAYQKGMAEGYEEGFQKAESLVKDAQNELIKAKAERQQILNQVEPEVVELITDIVKKLVGTETRFNSKIIVHLIKQGLEQTTISGSISIHVSKEDFDAVVSEKSTIQSMLDTKTELEIMGDPALGKNDCIIETPLAVLTVV